MAALGRATREVSRRQENHSLLFFNISWSVFSPLCARDYQPTTYRRDTRRKGTHSRVQVRYNLYEVNRSPLATINHESREIYLRRNPDQLRYRAQERIRFNGTRDTIFLDLESIYNISEYCHHRQQALLQPLRRFRLGGAPAIQHLATPHEGNFRALDRLRVANNFGADILNNTVPPVAVMLGMPGAIETHGALIAKFTNDYQALSNTRWHGGQKRVIAQRLRRELDRIDAMLAVVP